MDVLTKSISGFDLEGLQKVAELNDMKISQIEKSHFRPQKSAGKKGKKIGEKFEVVSLDKSLATTTSKMTLDDLPVYSEHGSLASLTPSTSSQVVEQTIEKQPTPAYAFSDASAVLSKEVSVDHERAVDELVTKMIADDASVTDNVATRAALRNDILRVGHLIDEKLIGDRSYISVSTSAVAAFQAGDDSAVFGLTKAMEEEMALDDALDAPEDVDEWKVQCQEHFLKCRTEECRICRSLQLPYGGDQ